MFVELPSIIRDIKEDIFKRTRIIYFNFSNGFGFDSSLGRDSCLVSMIASRIISSSFSDSGSSLMKKFPKSGNNQFLHEIFKIISEKLHVEDGIDKSVPIPIVLAFDEFQIACRSVTDLEKRFLAMISWYISEFQKSHGLLIIPVMGGSFTQADLSFLYSDHPLSLIRLKLSCFRILLDVFPDI